MTWTSTDIPDLTGRIAVVTGANGGLGLETARGLAGAGATVVMAARNTTKAAAASDSIGADHPAATLELIELDLADLASIERAAKEILDRHQVIDLLVNNAGVMAVPEATTADGFEMQFGTNHLGHWALTAQLLPAILRADAGRVVTVTSTAHHTGRSIDPDNPHLRGNYGAWKAYGQSKLANFHFGLGLDAEFRAAGARAASLIAHPGLSDTGLQSTSVEATEGGWSQRFFHRLAGLSGMSPEHGARPQLRASTDPSASGGQFYGPLFVNNGPAVRKPVLRRFGLESAIATLWEVSERETGLSIDVAATLADVQQ